MDRYTKYVHDLMADSGAEETDSHRRANCLLGLGQSVLTDKLYIKEKERSAHILYVVFVLYTTHLQGVFRLAYKVHRGNRLSTVSHTKYILSPQHPPLPRSSSVHQLIRKLSQIIKIFSNCANIYSNTLVNKPPHLPLYSKERQVRLQKRLLKLIIVFVI